MTRRFRFASLLALAALSTSCVSKKQHEALQLQLADKQQQVEECLSDKKSAQDLAAGMQRRLSGDEERFRNIESTLTTTIPEMAAEFEEDRKRILTLVPKEIRSQVGERLDSHFANVNTRLSTMQESVGSMEAQLGAAREELTALRGQTQGVSEKVDATNANLTGENADLKRRLAAQATQAATLVKAVTDFDATHLNCADCEERLKMKERSREALRSLHGNLVEGLAALQGKPGA